MSAEFKPMWKCPCGVEHGDMSGHNQTERLCPEHATGSGYRGVPPEYAKGKEAPEMFDEFKKEHPEQFKEPEKKEEKEDAEKPETSFSRSSEAPRARVGGHAPSQSESHHPKKK